MVCFSLVCQLGSFALPLGATGTGRLYSVIIDLALFWTFLLFLS